MAEWKSAGRGWAGVALAVALAGLLAACGADTPPEAAPVIMKGGELAPPAVMGPPVAMAPSPRNVVVVRPGQSVRGIAYAHHVSPSAIIAANHLPPPYKIETGQRLVIPGRAGAMPFAPAVAARPAPPPPLAERHAPPRRERERERARAQVEPEMIPLDGPAPPPAEAKSRPKPAEAAPPKSGDAEPATAGRRSAELAHGGHFPWPVHGQILSGYGVGPGGAHNDGINIAAPKGAPVEAVDGGVVAYAGNELRGYGNLVLVKHPNGWISAYAHCEQLLVKRGDKVTRGEVIAKVGATGGVNKPQLHFELRRGERPVDPREFLSPAPSAAAGAIVRRG